MNKRMIKGKDSKESELHWRYGGADCWLLGILVMKDGVILNSKVAHSWWEKKRKKASSNGLNKEAKR